MTWAKLDDKFHSHPKALRAWTTDPASVGLHAMALSWVAMHEQDGKVPPHVVSQLMPIQPDRDRALETLTQAGLWEPNGEGWLIHDYLDYNPSRAELEEKRRADSERKAALRKGNRPK